MRQIVLDTETTGLVPAEGHRIIEIGCIELVNRRHTGRHYHQYLQPDRAIDEGAVEVHGITNDFLTDKPRFTDVVEDFLAFVRGAELIIHNAPFDVGFLNNELRLLKGKHGTITDHCGVLDTLTLARKLHPGQKNNLDALCKRYTVDNSRRDLHGALLDAEILADVYLIMTGGQAKLSLEGSTTDANNPVSSGIRQLAADRPPLRVRHADATELAAHAARLDDIQAASDGHCLWRKIQPGDVG